ncbi:MAG: T9SS type A sorting domain-containing protein [Candidatus Cloacimonetes bacterium]|nr:T9SS type A sorting domain-containing protein [Candidatus Cloacimonadota bacterium]
MTHIEGSGSIRSVIQTADGGFAGTGYINSWTLFALKVDADGDTLWTHVDPDTTHGEQGADLCENNDGNILVGGFAPNQPYPDGPGGYAALFAPDGERLWHHYTTEFDSAATAIWQLENRADYSKFIMTSASPETVYLLQTDYDYNIEWAATDVMRDSKYVAPDNMLFYEEVSNWETRMILTDMNLVSVNDNDIPSPNGVAVSVYPNPFNPETTIAFNLTEPAHSTLCVYNIKGQLVTTLLDEPLQAGAHTVTWTATGCSSGIYFAMLKINNQSTTTKLLLLK